MLRANIKVYYNYIASFFVCFSDLKQARLTLSVKFRDRCRLDT